MFGFSKNSMVAIGIAATSFSAYSHEDSGSYFTYFLESHEIGYTSTQSIQVYLTEPSFISFLSFSADLNKIYNVKPEDSVSGVLPYDSRFTSVPALYRYNRQAGIMTPIDVSVLDPNPGFYQGPSYTPPDVYNEAYKFQPDQPFAAGEYYIKYDSEKTGWKGGGTHTYVTVTPVPEPETYAMLVAGLGVVGFMVRRKRKTLNE